MRSEETLLNVLLIKSSPHMTSLGPYVHCPLLSVAICCQCGGMSPSATTCLPCCARHVLDGIKLYLKWQTKVNILQWKGEGEWAPPMCIEDPYPGCISHARRLDPPWLSTCRGTNRVNATRKHWAHSTHTQRTKRPRAEHGGEVKNCKNLEFWWTTS